MIYLLFLIHLAFAKSCRVVRRLITRQRKPQPVDADVMGLVEIMQTGTHEEITQYARKTFTCTT